MKNKIKDYKSVKMLKMSKKFLNKFFFNLQILILEV